MLYSFLHLQNIINQLNIFKYTLNVRQQQYLIEQDEVGLRLISSKIQSNPNPSPLLCTIQHSGSEHNYIFNLLYVWIYLYSIEIGSVYLWCGGIRLYIIARMRMRVCVCQSGSWIEYFLFLIFCKIYKIQHILNQSTKDNWFPDTHMSQARFKIQSHIVTKMHPIENTQTTISTRMQKM